MSNGGHYIGSLNGPNDYLYDLVQFPSITNVGHNNITFQNVDSSMSFGGVGGVIHHGGTITEQCPPAFQMATSGSHPFSTQATIGEGVHGSMVPSSTVVNSAPSPNSIPPLEQSVPQPTEPSNTSRVRVPGPFLRALYTILNHRRPCINWNVNRSGFYFINCPQLSCLLKENHLSANVQTFYRNLNRFGFRFRRNRKDGRHYVSHYGLESYLREHKARDNASISEEDFLDAVSSQRGPSYSNFHLPPPPPSPTPPPIFSTVPMVPPNQPPEPPASVPVGLNLPPMAANTRQALERIIFQKLQEVRFLGTLLRQP